MDNINPRSFPGKPFSSLGERSHESREKLEGDLPTPACTRWDRFALERKWFVPKDSDEPRLFYWLSRAKAGERPKGLSIRVSEMRPLIEALERILAENDDANRGGR